MLPYWGKTHLFHGPNAPEERIKAISDTGTEVVELETHPDGLDLTQALSHLAKRGVVSLLVEGGGQVHGSFLKRGLVDEACLYIAPKMIGEGRPLCGYTVSRNHRPRLVVDPVEITPMGSDIRMRGRVVYPKIPEGGA